MKCQLCGAHFQDGKFEITPDLASRIVKRAPCSVFSVKALDQVFVLV